MSEFGKLRGLCQNCVRYNPKALAHCILARDAGRLARKWKYNLMVTDCEEWLVPEEVFPEPVKASEAANDVAINAILAEKEEEKE